MNNQELSHAYALCNQGLYADGFSEFLQLANRGDLLAITQVASMYYYGRGVERDFDKSVYWSNKAEELGSKVGFLNLSYIYRNSGDIRNAKKCLLKALEHGDGEAALQLAKMYMVSDLEIEKVIDYLNQAIRSKMICEKSCKEAVEILKELTEELH